MLGSGYHNRLYHPFSINLYTKFEQPAFDHFHLDIVFASQQVRRTCGNILFGRSYRARADFYFSHSLVPPISNCDSPLQCESFRYLVGKAAIKMAAQKQDVDIVGRLEGIWQAYTLQSINRAFDERSLPMAHKHALFR